MLIYDIIYIYVSLSLYLYYCTISRAANGIAVQEFGTDPCRSIFGRTAALFQTQNEYQNANVSVKEMAGMSF